MSPVNLVGDIPIAPVLSQTLPFAIVQASLAPDQQPRSACVCNSTAVNFDGTHVVRIDEKTGIGRFTDLSLRQAYTKYTLRFVILSSKGDLELVSDEIQVLAGDTVGLCPLSLP
jgi:hypothetical protein